MEEKQTNGRRRGVKKGTWGRAVRRMDRQTDRESRKDLKKLDGIRRRGVKRGITSAFLMLLLGGAFAFYFGFGVGSWQRLDLRKIVDLPQTGAIYDRNGSFVAKIQSAQDRVSVPLSLCAASRCSRHTESLPPESAHTTFLPATSPRANGMVLSTLPILTLYTIIACNTINSC